MANLLNYRPFGNHVLVRKFPDEWVSKNGILLAFKANTFLGTVLAVGEGKRKKNGKREPIEVKEGDVIMFKEFAGWWKLDPSDDRLMILPADEVEGIVNDPSVRVEAVLD